MFTLTLKEKKEMKRMGHYFRAWYTNSCGVPFHKDFTTQREMYEFTDKAHEVGTKFNGFAWR